MSGALDAVQDEFWRNTFLEIADAYDEWMRKHQWTYDPSFTTGQYPQHCEWGLRCGDYVVHHWSAHDKRWMLTNTVTGKRWVMWDRIDSMLGAMLVHAILLEGIGYPEYQPHGRRKK